MNVFPDQPNTPAVPSADSSGASPSTRESAENRFASPDVLPSGAPPASELGAGTVPVPTSSSALSTYPDPAWSGLDVLRLVLLAIVALFIGVSTVLFVAHFWFYPRAPVASLARFPLVVVAGQALAYMLLLAYMFVLVTRERRRPDFLSALHWNWPRTVGPYLLAGVALSLALQALAHLLPVPKNLPIDTFFRTPAEAWVITIFGITLAPLMEELFFRGFLYPVLVRGIGNGCRTILQWISEHLSPELGSWDFQAFSLTAAVFGTAFAFALLHGSQLKFSWGPVLVIFLVGTVLTMVRAYKNSVAAGLLIHIAYNATISTLMFTATDGFRHLEKLNQ